MKIPKTFRRLGEWWRRKMALPYFRRGVMIALGSFTMIVGLSIGYAALSTQLGVTGSAQLTATQGGIKITDVTTDYGSLMAGCGHDTLPVEWTDDTFTVTGTVTAATVCMFTATVTVENTGTAPATLKEIRELAKPNPLLSWTSSGLAVGDTVAAGGSATLKMTYYIILTGSGASHDFSHQVRLIWDTPVAPLIVAQDHYLNFSLSRRQHFDPTARISATDDADGDITGSLVRTCSIGTCPSDYYMTAPGDYTETYNVTNSAGIAATPVTIKIHVWGFKQITLGDHHGMALTTDGQVYVWGTNAGGLGNGAASSTTPVLLDAFSGAKMVYVDCGAGTFLAVDADGNLWMWGTSSSSSIPGGTNYVVPHKFAPPAGEKYVMADIYDLTGAALTASGKVYVWGAGQYGANGMASASDLSTPTQLTRTADGGTLPAIKSISEGQYGGGAIDENGGLWMWGDNYNGQLALGFLGAGTYGGVTVDQFYNRPIKTQLITGLSVLRVGKDHVGAITSDGRAHMWGSDGRGQLCSGPNGATTGTPYWPYGISAVSDLTVNSTATLFVWGNDSELSACGANSYGQLFLGHTTDSNSTQPVSPYPSQYAKPHDITTDGDSSLILTVDDIVYGVGRNDTGELASADPSTKLTPVVWSWTPPPVGMW